MVQSFSTGSRSITLGAGMNDTSERVRKENVLALLHDDRLFPADEGTRAIARRLYAGIRDLPIISPHGHTQAGWFARNEPFPDPVTLFVQPDHYVFRMLYSQGISLEELEIGSKPVAEPRTVWRIFASNYHLFRGTPSRLWLDYSFQDLFGMTAVSYTHLTLPTICSV